MEIWDVGIYDVMKMIWYIGSEGCCCERYVLIVIKVFLEVVVIR